MNATYYAESKQSNVKQFSQEFLSPASFIVEKSKEDSFQRPTHQILINKEETNFRSERYFDSNKHTDSF